ncbi:MAG: amidase, partial [Armatimonadetes bacterium]|nr:amidase [Armatimonadota bacterium]
MHDRDLDGFTLATLSRAIAAREVSPAEVTEACLARIERLAPHLNSFITVLPERALADARRAEAEIRRGERRGPLHGVPVAIKDIFATRGIRTTCGSRVLRDWVPEEDATVVRRLAEAGSVLLGKLNMSEFAYGAVHPDFGPPRNPWNLDRFTGGSSSGSGAAVAASLCFGSLGTDTGGSIRGPDAPSRNLGMEPNFRRVSPAGVLPPNMYDEQSRPQ